MRNLFSLHGLYKLIVLIFLIVAIVKIHNQLVTLNNYNIEIAALNTKIESLKNNDIQVSNNSKEDIEDIARKNLRMYYPNETPYRGY